MYQIDLILKENADRVRNERAELEATSQAKDEVKGRLLLDVVVGKGPAVLELLASEDEPLLVWGDALLVLDLGLDVLNGVGRLHFEGDGLAGQRLHEDLHGEVVVGLMTISQSIK